MGKKILKKIFFVEDNKDIQNIVKISLQDIGGFELKICTSGKEALDEAKKFNPDLFLFDVILPDISGPSILKELRKIHRFENTPAIFITAKYVGHELVLYRKLNVMGIIRKPFDPITLPDLIKNIYENHYELETPENRSYIIL